MHTTAFLRVSQGKGQEKNKEKKEKYATIAPAQPVYINSVYTSLAVNMFTRKPAALLRN